MQRLRLADLVAEVERRPATDGIRVVGVDGRAGSGKSTLARSLAANLDAIRVEIDDFLWWGDIDGWWDRFEAEALRPLTRGDPARYLVRDWGGDEFGRGLRDWRTVDPRPVVVVEGVTVTRAAVADLFTYRIWVDAPADIRLRRGVDRDGESHRDLWTEWMRLEDDFFDRDDVRGRADLVVCGAPPAGMEARGCVVITEDEGPVPG